MTVYKVIFHLATPIFEKMTGGKNPIMPDALLARVALERQGVTKTPSEISPQNLVFADLPIERVGKCYLCSSLFFPHGAYSKPDAIAGRGVDPQDVLSLSPSFAASTKALQCPDIIRHRDVATDIVTFYARVVDGREDEFVGLVKEAASWGIGPKTSAGYGQIAGVGIRAGARDWSYKKDGLPTRPLPKELFSEEFAGIDGVPVGMSCYYAPYWFRRNAAPCFLPPPSQYASFKGAEDVIADIALDVRALPNKAAKEKGGKKPAA